ncbi:MAG: UPF0280 family protein [Candidatus Hermodarchaeota archaeon]
MKIYKFHFIEKESDITIISESKKAILRAKNEFHHHRRILEEYIIKHKEFLNSFKPLKVQSNYKIINLMAQAAFICDVGPMATVAGAFADLMLETMKYPNDDYSTAKIALIENGGEIANDSEKPMKIALFAGINELGMNIGFLIKKEDCPIGIATSSATIGHAVSLGQADAVTIFAKNATIADGAATKIGNIVKGIDIEKSIKKGLDAVDDLKDVRGVFISRKNKIGISGKVPQMFKIKGDMELLLKEKIEYLFPGKFEIFK